MDPREILRSLEEQEAAAKYELLKAELKGEKGDKGDPGGEKGEKGDKGDKGDKGAPGKDGRDGIDGRDGRDGVDGKDGKDGRNGLMGPRGFKGDTGFGEKGDRGDKGEKGDKGEPGEAGITRIVGRAAGGGSGQVNVLADGAKIGTVTTLDFVGSTVEYNPSGVARVTAGAAGAHPDLAAHDVLGLATQAELDTHAGAADPHPIYETSAEAQAKVDTHAAAGNPHPVYTTDAEATTLADASVATHAAAGNPHPVYETSAEAQAKVDTHAGLADPHTGYRLESADHSHQSTGLQGGQLDHGLALTGLGDDDHPQYALDTDLTTHAGAVDPHTGYILESLADAAGDLLVASGDNAWTKLTKGADGKVLKMVSGAVAWDTDLTGAGSDPVQGSYTPGSFTVPTGFYAAMVKELQLTSSQRITLQGTARLSLSN